MSATGEEDSSVGRHVGVLVGESPVVRGVLVEDLTRIADLEEEVFGPHGWPLFVVQQIYRISGSWWLLLEDEGAVWGYVLTGFQSDDKSVAWILGLGVRAERRGRGYGEALMRAATDVLHRHGADVIRLSVEPDNRAARGLYEKLGFIDHNVVERNFYGPGEDRAILTLLLPVQDAEGHRGPRLVGPLGRLARRILSRLGAVRRDRGPAVPK